MERSKRRAARPLSDHRANLAADFQHAEEIGRPLFVTSNGKTAAVVLSPSAYDELAEKAELADSLLLIERGLADVKAEPVQDARRGIESLAARHGLKPIR
jgi:prevent-host-death family protein